MVRFLFSIFIFLPLSSTFANCKGQLINILESAEHMINSSNLDPRCKKLALYGGKPGCAQATVGTIWDLKAMIEPVLKKSRRLCNQPLCEQNKSLCLDLLDSEPHLIAVGIYGLIEEIDSSPWRSMAMPQ